MASKIYSTPRVREFTSSGTVLNGGKLYFYLAGTTTPATVYTSSAMTTAHAHPVLATTAGLFPAIWLAAGVSYDVTCKNSAGAVQWTALNYSDALTADEVGRALYPRTAAEIAAGITPTDYGYAPGDVRRYGAVGDGVADDTVAWANCAAANAGRKFIPAGTYLVSSQTRVYPNDVVWDNIQRFPPGYVGTEDQSVEFSFDQDSASIRIGASDTTSNNDENNYWRGLSGGSNANAWRDAIGLFSASFNRNGASYGTYSSTFGHDCVAYGVASIAAGAGSCAGDPDAPTSPAFEGYCALAVGKNVLASGSKSAALCEETQALSRASFAAGYGAKAGEYSGNGTGAIALGNNSRAYGEGAFAAGNNLQSSYGGFTIGSGINPGSALNNTRANAIALGTNTVYAPFFINPGSGTASLNDAGYAEFSVSPVYFTDYLGGVTLFTCGVVRPIITNSGGSGYGGVQLEASINGVMTSVCRADSEGGNPSLLPTDDNNRRLGSATLRWEVVYAGTGAINTSDINEKEQIRELCEQEMAVAKRLKRLVRAYKFKDAVAEKGAKARTHVGVIAQDVKAAFESEGLVAEDYGIICYDSWGDVYDKDGGHARKAGSRYGVRYDELLAFIIAAI